MEKRPVTLDLSDWVILTDLIKARPKKYQDKDHKGTDVYNLLKLTIACASPLWDDTATDREHRVPLVTRLEKYEGEGYRFIEFKPFDDQGDSLD